MVVALTGGPEGETLIRRAARIAGRSAGRRLLAVHVARSDGLAAGVSQPALARQRRLVEELGGSYHSVVGDDVAAALVEFALAENATNWCWAPAAGAGWTVPHRPGMGETVIELSGDIDVHMVTHERAGQRHASAVAAPHPAHARLIAGPVAGSYCRCC